MNIFIFVSVIIINYKYIINIFIKQFYLVFAWFSD